MPITAAEVVKKLLAKAGVTYDGDLSAEIPDDVVTSLDNQLLTIAAATNNHPDVKKVYFAQAYNGLDAEMKELITEFGLSDEVKAEIERAGGSTKKAVALARKIKELSEKTAPPDTKKHAEEIRLLNEKLAAEIQSKTGMKTEFDNQIKQIKIQTKLGGMISGYKTVFDDLDPVAKETGIQAILNKNLQDSNAEFTFDENGNLSLIKKDGTNLFGENHTLVTPQAFIDKSFSKILKVNGATPPNNNPAPPVSGGGQQQKNPALEAALNESLTNYQAGTKVAV